jgi:hypothetical protein
MHPEGRTLNACQTVSTPMHISPNAGTRCVSRNGTSTVSYRSQRRVAEALTGLISSRGTTGEKSPGHTAQV